MTLDHILFDLDRVRDARLIEQALALGREKINNDHVTSFTWVTLSELSECGAIISLDLSLPARLAMATPRWYERKCEAQSRAVWRGQMTADESASELEFWHRICRSLLWPKGWSSNWARRAA